MDTHIPHFYTYDGLLIEQPVKLKQNIFVDAEAKRNDAQSTQM